MDKHLVFLLDGLANGGLYAALALTLVVTYRSSGVLNFATGALAALGAYLYANLRSGNLVVPLPFLPKQISLGTQLAFLPAAVITIAICALVGPLLYLAVFRPLRRATPVAKAVASVGVMVVLNGVFQLRFGSQPPPSSGILPSGTWQIGTAGLVPTQRIWFAAAIVAIALVLAAAYRFTRFGLLTRAVAVSEKGAFVSGIQPDRIAAANWVISSAIAGTAGVLIAPIFPLTPSQYTLLVVPALAAAVLGQLQYMLPAVFGGLLLGMVQSDTDYLSGVYTWLPTSQSARYLVVSLVLILIVLVVRAKPFPSRGGITISVLGHAPRPRSLLWPTVIGTAVGAVAVVLLQGTWRDALINSFMLGIVSLSLVVVTGFAGQVSLAQLTLAGVAGFALSKLTTDWSVPFPLAPILAALFAAVVGVVIGLPALRIRGLPVAVVTLATAVAIQAAWFDNASLVPAGGEVVTGPKLFGLDMRAIVGTDFPRWQFGLLVLVVLVCVAFAVAKLRTSTLGSQMLAVRANERSAAGAGIAVVRVKIIAFGFAAFIAGLGGAMIAYYNSTGLQSSSYDAILGLAVFTGVYLTGITSVSGGIAAGMLVAGGVVAYAADKWINVGGWYAVLSGIGLIFTIIQNPEGAIGPIHRFIERRRRPSVAATAATDQHDAHLAPIEPVQGGEVVLATKNVRVQYGGVIAVDDVSLEVRQGTIVGLIGPNGAGKTTLLDAISGFAASTGTVTVCGSDLSGVPPHRRVRAALGRTFQHTELYEDLSVTENIVVGAAAAHGRAPKSVEETLGLLDLLDLADRPVAELSQGRRQLVSIARALIGNPSVLLLDEPAGGLDSHESQWLGLRLRRIRESGVTILLIDHDMHLVLNLCDSIYVLNFGKIIAEGTPTAIRADRAVAAAYLGSTHAEQAVAS